MTSLKAKIAAHLAAFERRAIVSPELRHAAVAVLISPHQGEPSYVLTRRALTLRRGAGNFALPGGHVEPGEDAVAAAIRETAEELGVALRPDQILGLLDDFVTLSGHVVTPVVFWSDAPLTIIPDPVEVHEAWRLPLSELDHPDSPKAEANPNGAPILKMFASGRWINPPTAAILYQFREVGLHGRSTRVGDVGQPSWTAN
ncbi:MAG TPA: CoA pyrophosphatase [Caulobacteraceae bacterium]|jgi:8-oxo-dGTP pyrophosphatase MutT (NUDIX family)|nr:CoA pyrophosphatase [Caulobacteraceae bacterium]